MSLGVFPCPKVTTNDVCSEYRENDSLDIMMPLLGLVLIVGWLPDMQVEAIPLACSTHMNSKEAGVDKFLNDKEL